MELFKIFGTLALNGVDETNEQLTETTSNASQVGEKLKKGIGTTAKWGAAIAGAAVAGGTALVKFAESSAATADNVDKMSQKIGISRQAYQELDFICSQSGTSVDTLQAGMKTLTAAMTGAANGTKANVAQFKKLGVSVVDSSGNLRKQEDVLFDTLKALQGVKNQTEKARLATQLFGRSGSEMMPLINGATGSIDAMKNKAHELGLVLDDETIDSGVEMTDTMDQMKRAISSLATKLGGALMPIVTKLANFVIKNLPTIEKMFNKLAPIMQKLFDDLLPIIFDLVDELLPLLADLFAEILPILSELFKQVLPILVDLLGTLLPPLIQITEAILPVIQAVLDAVLPILSTMLEVLKPILDVVVAIVEPIAKLASGLISGLAEAFGFTAGKTIEASDAAKQYAEECSNMKQAADDARAAIDEKAQKELASIATTENLWKELQTLCDEQGKVADKDKARADFLANQLSTALGIEISLSGNQIKNYQNLQTEIDKTIEKKKLEILMSAQEEKYKLAVQNRMDAETKLTEATNKRAAAYAECDRLEAEGYSKSSNEWKQAQANAVAAQEAYASISSSVRTYRAEEAKYLEAQELMMKGNTEEAIQLLSSSNQAFTKAADLAGETAAEQKRILEQQCVEAASAVSTQLTLIRKMSSNASETEKKEAQKSLDAAVKNFNKANAEYEKAGGMIGRTFYQSVSKTMNAQEFEKFGEYIVSGINTGIIKSKSTVKYAMETVSDVMEESFKKSNEINSPSRRYKKLAKWIPEGMGEGIVENEDAAIKPMQDMLDDMASVNGKKIGVSIASNIEGSESGEMASGTQSNVMIAKMDEFIQQIKNLKIYLNGEALVGELTPALDTSLGQMYEDKGRGR